MINVTRLDGQPIVVNADLVLTVESTPDTVIGLITGGRIMVKEPVEEVVEKAVAYRQRIAHGPWQSRVIPQEQKE
jgi:flagellar protein FlbD